MTQIKKFDTVNANIGDGAEYWIPAIVLMVDGDEITLKEIGTEDEYVVSRDKVNKEFPEEAEKNALEISDEIKKVALKVTNEYENLITIRREFEQIGTDKFVELKFRIHYS